MRDRELKRKAKVAEILLAAARQLAEGLEPERVYERFQELLAGVIQHDGLVISSYDELDDRIRCDYVWNEGNKVDPSTLPSLPLNRAGGGMQSRVIVSGESFLFNDVPQQVREREGEYYNVDPDGTLRKIPEAGPAATKAAMMVPVKLEGRVAGVVQLMTDQGVYTQEQVDFSKGSWHRWRRLYETRGSRRNAGAWRRLRQRPGRLPPSANKPHKFSKPSAMGSFFSTRRESSACGTEQQNWSRDCGARPFVTSRSAMRFLSGRSWHDVFRLRRVAQERAR